MPHTLRDHMHGAAGFQGSGEGFGGDLDGILKEEIKELEETARDRENAMVLETWTPADRGIVHLTVYRGKSCCLGHHKVD